MALRVTRLLLPAGGFALGAGRAVQKVSAGTEPVPPGSAAAKLPDLQGQANADSIVASTGSALEFILPSIQTGT